MDEKNVSNNIPDNGPETQPEEKIFTKAEFDKAMDKAVGDRLAGIMKKMPKEEELTAFRSWKESQQTEKERWDSLSKERDEAATALSAAQAELEQYKRERLLLQKGVPADDVDYYAYKIGKLVTDSLPFEKAAEEYLKEKNLGAVTVDTAAPLSGGKTPPTPNESMNSLIRGARK